ncbi:hypothetical protein CMO96_05150 [Candidatus Woesebacteria bacterium]|nr:hypothetical protein [Candidatus Woesebacteria bacterium]|tara:strand:- start:114 stop:617 length:504 start_codon:yes stop_codon:yes gene_type:complete
MKEVVGSGDIAQVLQEANKDVLFFASGVSNSSELRESEYRRERDLLLEQDKTKRLVYFSSLSIFYADTRYTRHKEEMEQMVKDNFPDYCIVRIGNIVWGKNPNTLINAMRNQVKAGDPLEIRDTTRYIVDKDEFLHWIGLIPHDFNCEINVPGRRMKVAEVVKEFVL